MSNAEDGFDDFTTAFRKAMEDRKRTEPDAHREDLRALVGRCESPIETRLLAAIYGLLIGHMGQSGWTLRVQELVGPYRADILVVLENVRIVVECDGHAFHERTREQSTRDKRRDRFFAEQAYTVLRFTGSEIWADPVACAEDVLMVGFNQAEDRFARRRA